MTYRDDFKQVEREVAWTAPRLILASVLVMAALYGFGFLATGGNLAIYRFWAPKQAAAERQVFLNTPSYIEGKNEYLSRLRMEYQAADEGHKTALREMILSEASSVDNTKLQPDLAAFIQSLKEN